MKVYPSNCNWSLQESHLPQLHFGLIQSSLEETTDFQSYMYLAVKDDVEIPLDSPQ